MTAEEILLKFPKKKDQLPEQFIAIYKEHYKKNREGKTKATSISMKMEQWLHKMVAKDVTISKEDKTTLEIGAGTLNQLKYEPNIRTYDVVEPFEELYKSSPYINRVRNMYKDISEITSTKYQRITSIATFEHILNLPEVVARAILLMDSGGVLRVAIPNEGTLLWKFGTKITGYEFRKTYGLDYKVLMRHEHVNTAEEIDKVLNLFFKNTSTNVYGICKKLAFYRFIECYNPNIENAKRYLEKITS